MITYPRNAPPKDVPAAKSSLVASLRTQRTFRRLVICLGLLAVALVAAAITMRVAIHGAEVQVPELTGMTVADAMRLAASNGLSATIADRFYSPTVPVGNVLTQFPEAGATVRREWIVRLVESLGPQKISIPNVTGMTQRDAVLAIRKAHLDLGTIALLPYPAAKPGTVIAQDPPAEAHGMDRPRVSLLLASEAGQIVPLWQGASPGGFDMPDFTGKVFHQAAQGALAAGLKLSPMVEAPASKTGVKSGVVVSQIPPPGTRVSPGARVQFTVGR